MGDFGVARDKWVCPNDRELSLRAKLKTGWSVKTSSINSFTKPAQLNDNEQDAIMNVIRRAETVDKFEQERVGRLVERLDNMKKNAMGNGTTQCILCADEFGLLGASPLLCNDCKKAVCTKCGVDTISAQKEPQWLCKICAETRETWKKSGAWFYRGLPKYVLPGKKTDHVSKYSSPPTNKVIEHPTGSPVRSYNSWLQNKGKASSDKEYTDSSDDEIRGSRLSRRHTTRKPLGDSVEIAEPSPSANYLKSEQPTADASQRSTPSPSYSTTALSASPSTYSPRHEHVEVEKSPVREATTPVRNPQQEEHETYKMSPVKTSVEPSQEPHSSPTSWYKVKTPVDEEDYIEKSYRLMAYRESRKQQLRDSEQYGHSTADQGHRVRRIRAPSPVKDTSTTVADPPPEEWTPDDASKSRGRKLYSKVKHAFKKHRR